MNLSAPCPGSRRQLLCLALAALALLLGSPLLPSDRLRFDEATAAASIAFTHHHYGHGEKYMPENMGPGVAVLDFDGDGRLDLYFVQGAPLAPEGGKTAREPAGNRLFRQREDGSFEDVSETSGADDSGYGMGVSFGDYDRDGDLDLYISNFGPNTLLRNRGDGSFEDVTEEAGVGCDLWSTGAVFFDADQDGDLDLFVANYVDFSFDNHKWCGNAKRKLRSYCHPDVYEGLSDVFYRNLGDGRFEEATRGAGLAAGEPGKGLGVSALDLDRDGHQDVYVANDSTMNHLFLGRGFGHFEESALLAGVGFNGAGQAEASMGVAVGDVDGDLELDLFLTHLDQETNTLYRNLGDSLFQDSTAGAGLASPSLPWVGFGTVLRDFDHDGDLDLFVTNGHIVDNIELFDPARQAKQPSQFFLNQGQGRFEERSELLGLKTPLAGRGAAAADFDRDGDLDLVLTQNGGTAKLLINHLDQADSSLLVQLVGTRSNPQGFGALLELSNEEGTQLRVLESASSYLSQSPPSVHFGTRKPGRLVVHWPSGTDQRIPRVLPGFFYTITEGSPATEKQPFSDP